jgi:hypothetical protein
METSPEFLIHFLKIYISTESHCRDRLIRTDVQFHPDAVSTQSVDGFVRHFRRWEGTIITWMAKMLENSFTVLQRHGRTPLPSILPLLT